MILLYLRACVLSHFSCVRLLVTPWTVAHQASLSMEFSREEYWNGLSFPPPGDLPGLGNEPASPELQADSLPLSHQGSPTLGRWQCYFLWVSSCPVNTGFVYSSVSIFQLCRTTLDLGKLVLRNTWVREHLDLSASARVSQCDFHWMESSSQLFCQD